MSLAIVILLTLIVATVAVLWIASKAVVAKQSLEDAIPLVSQIQDDVRDLNPAAAKETVDELEQKTSTAREASHDFVWRSFEWVPLVGPNLHAVRVISESVDGLVAGAVAPATGIDINAFTPDDGRFDVEAIEQLQGTVSGVHESIVDSQTELSSIPKDDLVGPVRDALKTLDAKLAEVEPLVANVEKAVDLVPEALGAYGPQTYLLLFQNNAESRGTGGNPAAIAEITADDGRLEITQQASSGDFHNNRPTPIIDLSPSTEKLYGTKMGRFIQDVTLSPDFSQTAEVVRAFWRESFGEDVDAVASFDPVALSYLLKATGPVQLPTGEDLTSENALPLLLNEVYEKYPDPAMQDYFFASSAEAVFDALSSGEVEPKKLFAALTRATAEGRLIYVSSDADEAAVIEDTRLSGKPPTDNSEKTMLGVYVGDITQGKLDYYTKLDVKVSASICSGSTSTFATSATFTSTLAPEDVPGLADYISPGRFFPKGETSTDLYFYGPVGAKFVSASVDGSAVSAKLVDDLDRPAVKINIRNPPQTSHEVTVEFEGDEEKYGPVELWHTPMVKETPVEVKTHTCEDG